jgi:hypothetical protein
MAAMNAANATSCTAVTRRSLMVTVKRNCRMLSNADYARLSHGAIQPPVGQLEVLTVSPMNPAIEPARIAN